MAQDDIVQRIVVEGADQAVNAFSLIEKGATQALGGIAQMAQGLVGSLGSAGIAVSAMVGTVTGFVGILENLTQHASESAAAIRGLAVISGTSVEDMSALVSAFSAAGVGAEGLVTNFRRLATTVSTEMPKVRKEMESAADTIAGANLKVGEAQIALTKAQGGIVSEFVEQGYKIKAAQIALSEATRAAAEASANDIRKFVRYFDDLAKGVQHSTQGMNLSLDNLRKGLIGSLGGAGLEAVKDFTGSIHDIGDPSVQTMLLKLADIFKTMPDGIQKTALATQLFGRSAGPGLITFLSQGSEAILKQKQHFTDLGLVITDVEQKALKRFRVANFELADVMDRLKEKFAAAIAPIFTERLEEVRHFLESHMDLWRQLGDLAGIALRKIMGLLDDLKGDLAATGRLILQMKSYWEIFTTALKSSDTKGALDQVYLGLSVIINQLNILVAVARTGFGKYFLGDTDQQLKDTITSTIGLTEKTKEAGFALLSAYTTGKISLKEYQDGLTALIRTQEQAATAAEKTAEKNKEVSAAAKGLGDAGTKAGNDIKDSVNGATGATNQLDEAIKRSNAVLEQLAQAAVDASRKWRQANAAFYDPMTRQFNLQAYDTSNMPMASGGEVHGPGNATSDSILARLSAGEFVMRTAAVQKYGLGLMHTLNALRFPGFATGGFVTGSTALAASTSPRVLNLTIEGRSFAGLQVPEHTAQSLERFAVHSQIASTGRKPSWRR